MPIPDNLLPTQHLAIEKVFVSGLSVHGFQVKEKQSNANSNNIRRKRT
jgi:hypothetical protein